MKTSIPLTLIGAACALLVSCGTSTRETLYVTTESGAPICGAYLDPCTPPMGCEDIDYSNGCGQLNINTRFDNNQTYSVKKDGFRTVNGFRRTGGTQRVIMVPGKPM
jgi:hypothetical protein